MPRPRKLESESSKLERFAPPVRLKKRGLGEPDVFVVWGPLMVCGTYYSAVGTVGWNIVLASLPYGLLCTTVLMGKHIDKIPYDEPLGIRTLPVLLGEARARVVTLAMMIGGVDLGTAKRRKRYRTVAG